MVYLYKWAKYCPDRESNPGHRNHNAEYSPLYDLDRQNKYKITIIIKITLFFIKLNITIILFISLLFHIKYYQHHYNINLNTKFIHYIYICILSYTYITIEIPSIENMLYQYHIDTYIYIISTSYVSWSYPLFGYRDIQCWMK